MNRQMLCGGLAALMFCAPATAVSFSQIRIGDADGFGLGTGAGLRGADDQPVNVDGVGILGNEDFLPDWNWPVDNLVQWSHGDDFDYRSAAEAGGSHLTGAGFADVSSAGSDFTDIALSTSYDSSSTGGSVHIRHQVGQRLTEIVR